MVERRFPARTGHRTRSGGGNRLGTCASVRDPAVFTDPHTFVPTRNADPHLSFSRGSHFRLGAYLACTEVHIALTALLDHRWRIADPRTQVGIDVLKATLKIRAAGSRTA